MDSPQPPMPVPPRKRTILCIEDEPDMINLLKLILERGGFRVMGAVGGEQGLEMARRFKPDAVLLDLRMPDTDGWEVARRMRADDALKDVHIIVLSVFHPNGDDDRELPVDDFVTKPFAPRNLVRRVRRALLPLDQPGPSEPKDEKEASGR